MTNFGFHTGPDAAARRRLNTRLDIAISLIGATPARLRELAEMYGVNGRMRREMLIPRVYWEMVRERETNDTSAR